MGCGLTKALIQDEEKSLSQSDRKSQNISVIFRIMPSEIEARKKFESEGTLQKNADDGHLELRMILDEPISQNYIGKFAAKIKVLDIFMCWIDIQEFRSIPTDTYRLSKAFHIFQKYLRDDSPLMIGTASKAERLELEESLKAAKKNPSLLLSNFYESLQNRCFTEIYHNIYLPFKATEEFSTLKLLLKTRYNRIKPSDFEYYHKLGEGAFGFVLYCKKKSTGKHYAMKIQNKILMLDNYKQEHFKKDKDKIDKEAEKENLKKKIMIERDAFSSLHHPFIVSLYYSFQTDALAIMVLDLALAGDLHYCLSTSPNLRLSEERVRFYMAEIVLALIYIHQNGLIYRDLKPQNILLNSDGHVQLVDLGGIMDDHGSWTASRNYREKLLPLFSKNTAVLENTSNANTSFDESFELVSAEPSNLDCTDPKTIDFIQTEVDDRIHQKASTSTAEDGPNPDTTLGDDEPALSPEEAAAERKRIKSLSKTQHEPPFVSEGEPEIDPEHETDPGQGSETPEPQASPSSVSSSFPTAPTAPSALTSLDSSPNPVITGTGSQKQEKIELAHKDAQASSGISDKVAPQVPSSPKRLPPIDTKPVSEPENEKKNERYNVPPEGETKKKRRQSIMGTLGYMAPEMVLMLNKPPLYGENYMGKDRRTHTKERVKKGYTNVVDWWSLGITTYKLLTGTRPFADKQILNFIELTSSLQEVVGENIQFKEYSMLFQKINFPTYLSREAKDFIRQLLNVNETCRLGSGPHGWENIKNHPFFRDIDWVLLEQKQILPPYVPTLVAINSTTPTTSDLNTLLQIYGKENFLVKPTPEQQKYFENWDFISPHTLRIEAGLSHMMEQLHTNTKAQKIIGDVKDSEFKRMGENSPRALYIVK